MNSRMADALTAKGIALPQDFGLAASKYELPILTSVDGSILLKNEFDKTKHAKLADFPDRTGYEAFINHVHFLAGDSKESLLGSLRYVLDLQDELMKIGSGRRFLIVMSQRNDGCVIRFHEIRAGESWISDNLEGYEEEGILVLPVESSRSTT